MKIQFCILLFLLTFLLSAANPDSVISRINALPEQAATAEEKKVLCKVIQDILATPLGKTVFLRAQNDLSFTVQYIPALGNARMSGLVTLGKARMDWMGRTDSVRERLIHCSALAEVIAHETTHSGQFASGCSTLSPNVSFQDSMVLELFLEIQAKMMGEEIRSQVEQLPEYRKMRIPRTQTPFYEFTLRGKGDVYARTLYYQAFWLNWFQADNVRFSRQTVLQIKSWNVSYTDQATKHSRQRSKSLPHTNEVENHLRELLLWTPSEIQPDFFFKNQRKEMPEKVF